MLAAGERPTIDELISRIDPLIDSLGQLAPEHREYLHLLGDRNEYRPELLFGDFPNELRAARVSPRMEWKLRNLTARAG